MIFRIGQKVVCVDASEATVEKHLHLVKGGMYTIIGFDPESNDGGIYLAELPRTVYPPYQFPHGWRASRFRPLVERKTDIGMLTALLDPANYKELVDG